MTTPRGPQGPEGWEQDLYALWDVVAKAREQGGKQEARRLSSKALQAVQEPKKEGQ